MLTIACASLATTLRFAWCVVCVSHAPPPLSWVLAVVALLWLSLPLPVLPVLVLAAWPV